MEIDYAGLRIRAFRSVQAPDREYLTRKVIRWFSKTFFTPIDQVEDMPLDDVMQAYYEDRYENMSEEDRDAEREDLLKTEAERRQEIMAEEAEEADMFEMARAVAAEEARKRAEAKKPGLDPKSQAVIAPRLHPVPGLLKQVKEKDAELPSVEPQPGLPAGIKMSFVEDGDLEAEIARFEALADGKKP